MQGAGPDPDGADDTQGPVILLVDDEPANLELLEAFLELEGVGRLVSTTDSREVPALLDAWHPDLLVLDLHMPHRSGFDVLEELQRRPDRDAFLPVLVLTADSTPAAKQRALAGGAHDFLTKPLEGFEVVLRVRNLLRTRQLYREQAAARAAAEEERRRALLLASASRVLGASLDCATGLEQLGRVLVPAFADEFRALAQRPEGEVVLAQAGAVPARADAAGQADATPGRAVGVDGAGSRTLLMPLEAAGERLGSLLLRRRASRAAFTPAEAELARELAQRAAGAMENARLFAEAQLATRARDQVLSVVAHDLRNPLAAIAADAEMLESRLGPDAPERQRRGAARIRRVAAGVERQLQDLLDVARLEHAGLPLRPAPTPVQRLVDDARELLEPLAHSRGVQLRFEGPCSLPPLEVDGARVVQVLSNLVGNALRYAPEQGEVRVSWRVEGGVVAFSVADDGPGIAPEQLPHLFTPFWQGNAGERHGAGLGLTIARALVQAHGGDITVESAPGSGATFHFTLPFCASVPAAVARVLDGRKA